jgi:hypothetical protein
MMGILGVKRIVILLVLVVLNVGFAVGVYAYLSPQKMQKQRDLNGLRGQIGTLQGDIDRLQVEFDQLEVQQAKFDMLNEHGFFGTQGRRQAEKTLESIQKQAGVISAVASIKAGAVEDNEEAQKADHKVLKSEITIRVEALDDTDVFRYLYLLEKFFPGHVAVTELLLERKADVSGTVLRGIASGANPPLVQADIQLIWRTMIPQSEIINVEPATESGGM